MPNMALKCEFHPLKFSKNKNLIGKYLIKIKNSKNLKNLNLRKKMIKNKNFIKNMKKEVRCFKCGQKGHIAPNCKNKVNVLSDKEEEYYSENNTSSSKTDISQTDSEKEIEKIDNCLCQVNMLTTNQ